MSRHSNTVQKCSKLTACARLNAFNPSALQTKGPIHSSRKSLFFFFFLNDVVQAKIEKIKLAHFVHILCMQHKHLAVGICTHICICVYIYMVEYTIHIHIYTYVKKRKQYCTSQKVIKSYNHHLQCYYCNSNGKQMQKKKNVFKAHFNYFFERGKYI